MNEGQKDFSCCKSSDGPSKRPQTCSYHLTWPCSSSPYLREAAGQQTSCSSWPFSPTAKYELSALPFQWAGKCGMMSLPGLRAHLVLKGRACLGGRTPPIKAGGQTAARDALSAEHQPLLPAADWGWGQAPCVMAFVPLSSEVGSPLPPV